MTSLPKFHTRSRSTKASGGFSGSKTMSSQTLTALPSAATCPTDSSHGEIGEFGIEKGDQDETCIVMTRNDSSNAAVPWWGERRSAP